MLKSLNGDIYCELPAKRLADFNSWASDLTQPKLEAAEARVRRYAEEHNHIELSIMAGADWRDKPEWEEVYRAVPYRGENVPRFFLGLILWRVLAEDNLKWHFYRPERQNQDVSSPISSICRRARSRSTL